MTDFGPPRRDDLELLRQGARIDPAAKGRIRMRLSDSIVGLTAAGLTGLDSPRVARGMTARIYGLVAIAFAAGAVAGAGLYAIVAPPTKPRVVVVAPPTVTASAAATPAAPVPSTSSEAVAPPLIAKSVHSTGLSQLSAERQVVDEARRALLRGDTARALEALERHRRAFPSQLLAEEHDALEVQALVRAERFEEALARAEAFRHRFPDSMYLPMVDTALASIP